MEEKSGGGGAEHKGTDELSSHLTCSICLCRLSDPVILKCGHTFDRECLQEWRQTTRYQNGNFNHDICPEGRCRIEFDEEPVKDFLAVRLLGLPDQRVVPEVPASVPKVGPPPPPMPKRPCPPPPQAKANAGGLVASGKAGTAKAWPKMPVNMAGAVEPRPRLNVQPTERSQRRSRFQFWNSGPPALRQGTQDGMTSTTRSAYPPVFSGSSSSASSSGASSSGLQRGASSSSSSSNASVIAVSNDGDDQEKADIARAIQLSLMEDEQLVPPAGPSNQDDVELIDDSDYDSQATIPAITENNEDNPGSGNEGGPAQTSS